MKEDVLEQVAEDYLQLRGYFTMHNLRFKPDSAHLDFLSAKDSVASDVDVIGINPLIIGPSRVRVVSCKAWQTGFNPGAKLLELRGEKKNAKRETWRHFRELWEPKWSEAFRRAVHELTGEPVFTYSVAVTKLTGKQTQPRVRCAGPYGNLSRVTPAGSRDLRLGILAVMSGHPRRIRNVAQQPGGLGE